MKLSARNVSELLEMNQRFLDEIKGTKNNIIHWIREGDELKANHAVKCLNEFEGLYNQFKTTLIKSK